MGMGALSEVLGCVGIASIGTAFEQYELKSTMRIKTKSTFTAQSLNVDVILVLKFRVGARTQPED